MSAHRLAHPRLVCGETIPGMEALVCALVRLHSPGSWENMRVIMSDRHHTRTYGHIFYYVIDHIFDNFKKCIDDITRWEEWVRARSRGARVQRGAQLNVRKRV